MSQSDSQPQVTTQITVLWAIHDRYRTPHVVRAWSQALSECYDDQDLITEAKGWMEHWGDETGWTYWTTIETIPVPAGPPADEDDWWTDGRRE